MSDGAYEPYAPLGVLKPIADDVWIVDGPEVRMAYLGLHVPFPTRMTVIRLPDGGLWLHSPLAPSEGLLAGLQQLGPIRFLVAPNRLHYTWLSDWAEIAPAAGVYLAPGLRRSPRVRLPAGATLGDEPPAAWAEVIDQVVVRGDLFIEVDFFHLQSRTLVLTDLIENFEMQRVRRKILRWVLRLSGNVDPDGKAPIDMQLSFLRHRKALRAAVGRMIAWAPEHILIAHGRCYAGDGANELRRAFRWVLER